MGATTSMAKPKRWRKGDTEEDGAMPPHTSIEGGGVTFKEACQISMSKSDTNAENDL